MKKLEKRQSERRSSVQARLAARREKKLVKENVGGKDVDGTCNKGRMWLFKQGRDKVLSLLSRAQEEDNTLNISKVIKLLTKVNRSEVTEEALFKMIGSDVVTIDKVMDWVFEKESPQALLDLLDKAEDDTNDE